MKVAVGAPSGFPLEIDIGDRLPVGVADIKAGFGFLNGPGRRETAIIVIIPKLLLNMINADSRLCA